MRIISNYKDYYDSLQDYSDSTVWERNYQFIQEKDPALIKVWNKLDLFNYRKSKRENNEYIHTIPIILGYCGNYYKFWINEINSDYSLILESNVFYPSDKNSYSLIDVTSENSKASYFISSSFFTVDISYLLHENLFIKYNSPILIICPYITNKSRDYFSIVVNPSLKKLGYHKKKDIQQVYQELDMYISGVLTNKEDRPQLDEKHRKGARFDKYSFRRLPENERGHN